MRYGKLSVLRGTGNFDKKMREYLLFRCDCGQHCERTMCSVQSSLAKGFTPKCKSCNKLVVQNLAHSKKKHGMSRTKVHNTWCSIKDRCINKNSVAYDSYGGAGITMDDKWVNDFAAFYEHVGDPPENSRNWSLDRVDNTKGYVENNVRWATQKQQCQNRSGARNKKLPIGVYVRDNARYIARCLYNDKDYSISFSINKYGEELARFLAEECRELMIDRLRTLGEFYTESHGLNRFELEGLTNDYMLSVQPLPNSG